MRFESVTAKRKRISGILFRPAFTLRRYHPKKQNKGRKKRRISLVAASSPWQPTFLQPTCPSPRENQKRKRRRIRRIFFLFLGGSFLFGQSKPSPARSLWQPSPRRRRRRRLHRHLFETTADRPHAEANLIGAFSASPWQRRRPGIEIETTTSTLIGRQAVATATATSANSFRGFDEEINKNNKQKTNDPQTSTPDVTSVPWSIGGGCSGGGGGVTCGV